MTNQCRHVCYITHACIFLYPYYRHLPACGRSGRVVLISIVRRDNLFLIRDEFRIHEWKIFVLKRRFPVRKNEN